MKRPIIAVDIDDVLAAGSEGFAEFSNLRWGTSLTAEHYDEDFSVVWGIPLEEALERVREYLISGAHGRFRHFDDALPVLTELSHTYELVLVTSRRSMLKPETDVWIERHFPGLFTRIIYAGIFDEESGDVRHKLKHTKADILLNLGAAYLIDDQPKHCFAAAKAGITSFLFGDYRWNRVITKLPSKVVRVKSWTEVGRYFNVEG